MVLPETLREELVNQDVGIVFVDLDLFQDHAPLALDLSGGEHRVQHQVGQHVERDRHVLGQRLYVEADGLFAGKGVQVPADRIHFAGDVLGRTGARALENHVLDKVGDSVGLRGLATRTGLDPHPHRDRAEVFHPLGQNDQAIRQYGAAKISLGVHCVLFNSKLSRRDSGCLGQLWTEK